MKLRELNGAIRKTQGSIKLRLHTRSGVAVSVGLVKSELLAGLAEAFGNDPKAETYIRISDGNLGHEAYGDEPADFQNEPAAPGPLSNDAILSGSSDEDDLDDLLG